jgi:hypothetical protein
MKNKKLTYFLLVAVIGIWGVILYRIFSAAGGDDPIPVVSAKIIKESYDDYTIPKDTTHLLLNYRDPFGLVREKDTTVISLAKKAHKYESTASLKPAIDWNFIKYTGYVRNTGSKTLVAILSINGKSVMMAEGETAEKVTLMKNMRDSVKISFNGKTKFILMHPGTI